MAKQSIKAELASVSQTEYLCSLMVHSGYMRLVSSNQRILEFRQIGSYGIQGTQHEMGSSQWRVSAC